MKYDIKKLNESFTKFLGLNAENAFAPKKDNVDMNDIKNYANKLDSFYEETVGGNWWDSFKYQDDWVKKMYDYIQSTYPNLSDEEIQKIVDNIEMNTIRENKKTIHEAFSRQHYQAIADILKTAQSVSDVRMAFVDLFKQDNPRFDTQRFLDASR